MAEVTAIRQTTQQHIHELRNRLGMCVIVMLIGAGLAYGFRGQIIAFLQRPLARQLFYTSPMGSFEFVMQVCLLCGLILALPVIFYQLLRYIEPAFSKQFSPKLVGLVITSSFTLAIAGIAFAYYVSLPAAFRFFNAVGTSSLHPLITIDQYFSFVVGYLATFAIIFQLPLLLLFVNNIAPLGPSSLSKWRKHVVVAAFAIALILPSAPDPLSQVILALPIIILYELSIWIVRFVNHLRRRKATASIRATERVAPANVVPRPQAQPHPRQHVARPIRRVPVLNLREAATLDLRETPAVMPEQSVRRGRIIDLRGPASQNPSAA